MKTVIAYKEHWEEINLLRLIYAARLINEKISAWLRFGLVFFNVLLYVAYSACKGLYLVVKILFLTEPRIMNIERDETWIFRQIK